MVKILILKFDITQLSGPLCLRSLLRWFHPTFAFPKSGFWMLCGFEQYVFKKQKHIEKWSERLPLSQILALYRVCSPRDCPTEGKFKGSKPILINSDLYFYPQPVLKMFLFLAPVIRLGRTLACSRGCRSLWLKYKLLQFFTNLALCWLVTLRMDLPLVY